MANEDLIQDIREEIDALRLIAETGAQWAEICRLAAEIEALGGSI